jgi:hypothetical protein
MDHVNTAIGLASDGDMILIPNGSCTWTSGISTTKQIIIRAQNYTPTPAGTAGSGATSRNVTLTHNSSASLFTFVSGNSYHVGLGGIRVNEGTGTGAIFTVSGSGSKVPLIFDCYFQVKYRSWPDSPILNFASQGGVIWNTVFVGTFDINGAGNASFLIKGSPRVWTTASTMGANDTGGVVNVYLEDSTAINIGQFPDIDDHGRFVSRYNILDGTWGLTHGFTSTWGGRHFEYYNNVFRQTTAGRNLAGRYFWARAGTGIFTNNEVNTQVDPGYYGTNIQLYIGDNTTPSGGYPMDRQPGGGHNGSAYIVDPIYIWSQTGARAYTWEVESSWASYVQSGRDIFVNSGAKSGYTKYTYPHPMRSAVEDTSPDTTAPTVVPASTSINSAGTSLTIGFSETVTIGSGGSGGLTLSASGGAVTATYSSGSNSTSLIYTLSRVIASGETITRTYTQPVNGIEDLAGNDLLSFSGISVTNSSTQTPPTLSTKTIALNGTTLTLVFNEIVTTTALSGAGGWTITPSGGAATLSYFAGSGTTSLVYTISRQILTGETATVSYSGTYVRDATFLNLATITNSSVTNNSDSVAAFIDNLSPSGILDCTSNPRNVTLSLTTNEAATVRMTTVSGSVAYADMTDTFTTTGGTSHSEIKSLACGASYNYWVRSSDAQGNVNTSSSLISFSISNPQIAGPGGLKTYGGVKIIH